MTQSNQVGWITAGFAALLAALILSSARDEDYEINTITGAHRTRIHYAFFIEGKDRLKTTWACESADRQDIPTENCWVPAGSFRTIAGMKSRGCVTDLPAATELNLLFPDGKVPPDRQAEADALLRKFVDEPDETLRRNLVWDAMLLNR